jgi:hypothetical protein
MRMGSAGVTLQIINLHTRCICDQLHDRAAFPPQKKFLVLTGMDVSWPQSRSECCRENKNVYPCLKFNLTHWSTDQCSYTSNNAVQFSSNQTGNQSLSSVQKDRGTMIHHTHDVNYQISAITTRLMNALQPLANTQGRNWPGHWLHVPRFPLLLRSWRRITRSVRLGLSSDATFIRGGTGVKM